MSWRDIPGRAAYLWVYDAFIASNPRQGAVVVECGVALGKSLAYLCERLDAASRDDVQVFAVDPWAGEHRNGEQQAASHPVGDFTLYAETMIRNAPRAFERIRVLRTSSIYAANLFPVVDLCILDADHSHQAVQAELLAFHHAQWIGGDDMVPEYPGVEQAVRERFGDEFEYRAKGGPWDNPEEWDWGTWLRRGALRGRGAGE